MRQIHIFLLLFSVIAADAQNYIDLRAGFSSMQADAWNQTIQTYNETRFFNESKLPNLRLGHNLGLGFSGVLGKGVFISPSLQYREYSTESNLNKIDLHWFDLGLACDIYPLEFGLDSVAFILRPFFRIGFAGTMLLTRIDLADGPASVDGEPYAPYNWPYLLQSGIGLRYQPWNVLGFFLLLDGNYSPNASITDFRRALLGSLYAYSGDNNRVLQFGLQGGITFRIKN
jgi:hypothetical protein